MQVHGPKVSGERREDGGQRSLDLVVEIVVAPRENVTAAAVVVVVRMVVEWWGGGSGRVTW